MAILTSKLILSLIDHVTAPAREIRGQIARLNDGIAANKRAISDARSSFIGATATAGAFALALAQPIRAAAEFESAMADVKKVVDFPTPKALAQFKNDLIGLSTQIPMSVTQLSQIAAAAGQAGIAAGDILKFTEAAAKIGVAFDISADQAGDALAKLMTSTGQSLDDVILLSDAMNHLSNAQASSAAEILDVVRRVGAQGQQFGFTAKETAAFASAMISAGAESDVAATSFANMGRALTRGASATKRSRDAMALLGLDAEQLARQMQDDAAGTVIDVLEKIRKMPEEMRAALSSDLFGDEARALGPLLTNTDLLRQSLNLVGDESAYAGSSFKEFEVRAGTFNSQFQTFLNTLESAAIAIGLALIPKIESLMDMLRPVVQGFTDWAGAHPDLIANITLLTAGLLGLRAAVLGFRLLGLVGKGGVLWAVGSGLSFIAAITGAPFLAVAGGVTALGIAGIELYRNWDGNKSLIENVKAAWQDFVNLIPDWVKKINDLIHPLASAVELGRKLRSLFPDAPDLGSMDEGVEQRREAVRRRLGGPGARTPFGGIIPQNFTPSRSTIPQATQASAVGSSGQTLNVGDIHVDARGTGASAHDIARAMGDELRGLMRSNYSNTVPV